MTSEILVPGRLFANWTQIVVFEPLLNALRMEQVVTGEDHGLLIFFKITIANCTKFVFLFLFFFVLHNIYLFEFFFAKSLGSSMVVNLG